MKKILLLLIIFCIVLFPSYTSALYLETPNIDKIFTSFIKKVDRKFKWNKKVKFLEKLNSQLSYILEKKKLSDKKTAIIRDLQKLTNKELFNISYKKVKSSYMLGYSNFKISDSFSLKSTNNENIFLENWIWYYYKFWAHLAFARWMDIKQRDIEFNWIDSSKSLLFIRDDNNLWFVKSFEKIKLVSDDIILWIPDKFNFLKELKDDKKSLVWDTDALLKTLRDETILLTKWKTENEKIKIIYNYILDNITYPLTLDLANKNIYSWLSTYNLKTWACEWYTKLFMYMANFAWISDVEVIRWYVIDAQDFPNVWHAWIRHWNTYYDPTFDDPVWWKETLTYDKYKYFKLPKELFYTNRYLYKDLPNWLKTTSLDYRKTLIQSNLSSLVKKYWKSGYNLLDPYKFKSNNWISYNEKIKISNFNKIKELFIVKDFSYNDNWRNKTISKLSYYSINDDNLENIINQLNYNLKDYYYYKWDMWDWTYDYRLAYDLEFR